MQFLKMLSILALAVVFLPIHAQAQDITPVRAKLRANKGTLVVDVRERDEVATVAYDLKNVVNIPLSELKSRMTEIPMDAPVILACKTGNRSGQAMEILKANGYSKVSNLEGGILAWEAKDLGVVKGGAPAKACCSGSGAKAEGAKSCGSSTSASTTGTTATDAAAPAKACCAGGGAKAEGAKSCGSSTSASTTSATATDAAAPAKACCAGGGAKAEAAKSCGSSNTSAEAGTTGKACCAGGAKAGGSEK